MHLSERANAQLKRHPELDRRLRPVWQGLRGGAVSLVHAGRRLRSAATGRRRIADYLARQRPAGLHVGCGYNALPGWLNVDLVPWTSEVLVLDAGRPLPLPDGALDYVFSEHLIEHLPYAKGLDFLRECHRCLRPGGTLRIATPDVHRYIDLVQGDLSAPQEDFTSWYLGQFERDTPGPLGPLFVLNGLFRYFGHQFIYDAQTLGGAMELAGFRDPRPQAPLESPDPHLRGLERHKVGQESAMMLYETMVLEATA